MRLQKSTVSYLVGNLERSGWIVRTRSASDGRALEVRLTEAGTRAAEDLAAARRTKMAGIVDKIPGSERANVLRALRTLIEAIHENDP